MPPRVARGFLRPLSKHHDQFTPSRSPFSASTKAQAADPYTSILDALEPAKTTRPPRTPITSRSPARSSDSSNPALGKIPPLSARMDNKLSARSFRQPVKNMDESTNGNNGLLSAVRSALPARGGVIQQDADRKQYQQHVRQIEAQAMRNWRDGDVYSPHDLSPVEMQKSRQARLPARSNNQPYANTRKKGGKDVLDDLGIDPLKEYKNFAMMSEFMTEMGRIRHSRDTGLRAVNQRRMAKAVRRAIGIGIMPSVHRHPELMEERLLPRKR